MISALLNGGQILVLALIFSLGDEERVITSLHAHGAWGLETCM